MLLRKPVTTVIGTNSGQLAALLLVSVKDSLHWGLVAQRTASTPVPPLYSGSEFLLFLHAGVFPFSFHS